MFWTTACTPPQWFAGGRSRPELQRITVTAFAEFGATTYIEPLPEPPAGDLGRHYRYLPRVAAYATERRTKWLSAFRASAPS